MSKKSGEKKSLVEKVVDAVDHVIHPSAPETDEPQVESSQEPKTDDAADMQLMSKKKKPAPSEMGEHKKFDKFKRSEQ